MTSSHRRKERHHTMWSRLSSPLTALFLVAGITAIMAVLLITDTTRAPVGEVIVAEQFEHLQASVTEFEDTPPLVPVEEETVEGELVAPPTLNTYLRITESCGPHFEGACVNARSAPTTSAPALLKLRNDVVLRTNGIVTGEDGSTWHRIIFDEWVRYPSRTARELFVSTAYGELIQLPPPVTLGSTTTSSSKRIIVDRSEQRLIAYNESGSVFMDQTISTGLDATPTPRGTFTIFHKTPSRYMQGPLPGISSDYYDLPGVPWNLYFTEQGGALHGAYWHDKFGRQWSHGCVNLPPEKARELYLWADLGTNVTIRD